MAVNVYGHAAKIDLDAPAYCEKRDACDGVRLTAATWDWCRWIAKEKICSSCVKKMLEASPPRKHGHRWNNKPWLDEAKRLAEGKPTGTDNT